MSHCYLSILTVSRHCAQAEAQNNIAHLLKDFLTRTNFLLQTTPNNKAETEEKTL